MLESTHVVLFEELMLLAPAGFEPASRGPGPLMIGHYTRGLYTLYIEYRGPSFK